MAAFSPVVAAPGPCWKGTRTVNLAPGPEKVKTGEAEAGEAEEVWGLRRAVHSPANEH